MTTPQFSWIHFLLLAIYAIILLNWDNYCDQDGSLKQSVKTSIFGTFQK